MLKPGERLGAYLVMAFLRKGGMASLYLGRRAGAEGEPIALKLVDSRFVRDDIFVRTLLDEATLAVRIRHPNVVRVDELGEDGGRYFIAMEYVHGGSLAQLLAALARDERSLPPAVAVHIAAEALAGLHAAHETTDDDGEPLGVVHRDVSPGNVLVSDDGRVRVIDFGIAKARGRAVRTSAGTLKGKFRYMAPEQASGRPVDRRTDLYALAIVLWELLTLRPMNDGKHDVELLMFARDPKVVGPAAHVPGLPPMLDRAVLRALARDPEARPANALAFRNELLDAVPEAAAVGGPVLAQLLGATLGPELAADLDRLPADASTIVRRPR